MGVRIALSMSTDASSNAATQCNQILAYLRSGRTLTPLEALDMFGCFRLGARIWDLKKAGHDIRSRMVDVGDGKRVARYLLVYGVSSAVTSQTSIDFAQL